MQAFGVPRNVRLSPNCPCRFKNGYFRYFRRAPRRQLPEHGLQTQIDAKQRRLASVLISHSATQTRRASVYPRAKPTNHVAVCNRAPVFPAVVVIVICQRQQLATDRSSWARSLAEIAPRILILRRPRTIVDQDRLCRFGDAYRVCRRLLLLLTT